MKDSSQTIFIAADHAGVALKQLVLPVLRKEFPQHDIQDLGPNSEASVDYPDYAAKVAEEVSKGKGKGILICGSGIGMCISANKIRGVRAASAWDATSARLSRMHNDANITCIGARLLGSETALDAMRAFIQTPFEGGRHQGRVDKISNLEKGQR